MAFNPVISRATGVKLNGNVYRLQWYRLNETTIFKGIENLLRAIK